MSLDYHLDRKIRLSTDSEYENLYKWSLQEVDESGEQVGSDQVPWAWRLYFTATNLRYWKRIERDIDYESSDDDETDGEDTEDQYRVEEYDQIIGDLHPGALDVGEWDHTVRYSMFGTDRKIETFTIRIFGIEDEDVEEKLFVSGIPSYTSEVDFRNITEPDVLEFTLRIKKRRFEQIAELVKNKQLDLFQLAVKTIRGFYSGWSPSISTDHIKVLTRYKEQKVEVPENCKIDPPRLKVIEEFSLTIIRKMEFDFQQKETEEEDWDDEIEEELEPDPNLSILMRLVKNEAAISKLVLPAWLAVILLGILLLQFVF